MTAPRDEKFGDRANTPATRASHPIGLRALVACVAAAYGVALASLACAQARSGALLRRIALRAGAIDGGLITYSVGGKQFIAVAAGDNNPTFDAKGDNAIVILGLL